MALTATFASDFRAFTKGIEDAQVKLQVFERATKNATRGLTRELESISGQKVAVEAARMAEAVKRLGGEGGTAAGLLKLTDAELRRLQGTLDAAAEKAGRLGEALPASLKQVRDELSKIPKPADDASNGVGVLGASFGKLTAAFSAASLIDRGVSALFSFGAAAIQSAGDLVDLNKATGVSIETLQRWAHVADQGGIQLDNMTTAAFKLGAKLDGGGSSVREAVERLGLAFGKIQAMKPEDQMDAILVAAEALGPTQERNAVLVELFGARGAQALARIVEGYKDTAAAASVAGDDQVKAIDRASDRWSKFVKDIGTGFTQAMGSVVLAFDQMGTGIEDLTDKEKQHIGFLKKSGGDYAGYIEQLKRARIEQAALAAATAASTQQTTADTKNYVAEFAKLQKAIDDVVKTRGEELAAAVKVGASQEEIERVFGLSEEAMRLYKGEVKDTATALESADDFQARFNDSVAKNATEAKKAATELARYIDATNTKIQFGGDTTGDITKLLEARYTGPIAKALQSNFKVQQQHQRDLDVLTETRTLSRLEVEIAAIERWAADQKAVLDTAAGNWKEAAAAIDEMAAARKAALAQDDAIDEWERMNRQAAQYAAHLKSIKEAERAARREMASSLRDLSSAFADLAQSTGGSDGFLGDMAELVGLMGLGATAGNQFRDTIDSIGEAGKITAGDITQLASSALAAVAALEQATDRAGAANRAFAGAAVGAQIGAQFGPKGAAIGAGIGALVGLLRKPAFEDVMRRVGRDWGVAISEELARGIADQAKKEFGGNRQAAELFNFSKILDEAGGLNADNLDQMVDRFRDVFVMFETGAFTAAQAVQVLDENWRAFVEAGTDAAGRLRPELVEIIRLTREMGLASQEIIAYQREQAASAIEGLNAVVNAFSDDFEVFDSLRKEVADSQKAIDALNAVEARGRGADWAREMAEAQARLTDALENQSFVAEQAQNDLALLGSIAVGVYGAAIEAGMSHAEALKAAQPGLAQLAKAYADLGISAEDAGLQALLMQSQLLTNAPHLVAGVDGLAQSFIALSNLGLLNVDTFRQMQEAGFRMFTRIQGEVAALGGSQRDALIPMQAYLREAAKQAELLGIPLDANTQMLIDQSKELGIWKDDGEDAGETLQDTMRDLRDVFKELIDTMKGIPKDIDTTVTTRYRTEGAPPGANTNPTSDTTTGPGHEPPGHRFGSGGIRDYGSGTLVELHGLERVQTLSQMVAEQLRGASRGGDLSVVVLNNDRGLDADAMTDQLLAVLPRAIGGNQHKLRQVIRQVATHG